MKTTVFIFLINALLLQAAFSEITHKSDLAAMVWSYFESHESEVREFHSDGGHLPDKVDVFFNLIKYKTEAFAENKLSPEEELKVVRFLRRHLSSVAIICAPGDVDGVEEINRYREQWLKVVLELDEYEGRLLADVELQ